MTKPASTAASAFDLHHSLTHKENRVYHKLEHLIPYWEARMPAYGWKESENWHRAEDTRHKLEDLEKKAYLRWQESNCFSH